MKAEAIIEAVVNAGGELTVSGDRIRYRLPKDCPEKERILDGLREHKPEIIRALASRPATCPPSCYEIEPGRWIHHPWNGCRTPLPESAEPTVPTHADCGCSGPVCRRCWLCAGTLPLPSEGDLLALRWRRALRVYGLLETIR